MRCYTDVSAEHRCFSHALSPFDNLCILNNFSRNARKSDTKVNFSSKSLGIFVLFCPWISHVYLIVRCILTYEHEKMSFPFSILRLNAVEALASNAHFWYILFLIHLTRSFIMRRHTRSRMTLLTEIVPFDSTHQTQSDIEVSSSTYKVTIMILFKS